VKPWVSKRFPGYAFAVLAVSAMFLLTACVAPLPRLDARMGTAVNTARSQQTANPHAALGERPVVGIDGQAGDAVFDSYRESFVNPRPAVSGGVVNVGTGRPGSGSGGASR
jgi:hypothetical protein